MIEWNVKLVVGYIVFLRLFCYDDCFFGIFLLLMILCCWECIKCLIGIVSNYINDVNCIECLLG